MLYLAHSTFILTFPTHLLLLRLFSSQPILPILDQLGEVFHHQLTGREWDRDRGWPWRRTIFFVGQMTGLITIPSLLWYCAVPFTSSVPRPPLLPWPRYPSHSPHSLSPRFIDVCRMTSITSIYNTSALFAYVFSVLLLPNHTWDPRKLLAVLIAVLGVFVVAYGGTSGSDSSSSGGSQEQTEDYEWSLIGDGMSLAAAISYAFYEVIYKRSFTLPPLPTQSIPFALHPSLFQRPSAHLRLDRSLCPRTTSTASSPPAL